jgi:DNA mismatch repair protein MutS
MDFLSIPEEYEKYQRDHEKKYGENTIVIMQVGSFYELYALEKNEERLRNICETAHIEIVKKSVKDKDFYMAGFPMWSKDKFLNIFVSGGYTVVVVEQCSQDNGGKKLKRQIKEILSPSINTDISIGVGNNKNDYNNLLCVYMEESQSVSTGKKILYSGMGVIDVTTGKSILYQKILEDNSLYDLYKFIHTYKPKEAIIFQNLKTNIPGIAEKLELSAKTCHILDFDKDRSIYLEPAFQNKFLRKIFNKKINDDILSPIQYLDLEKRQFCCVCYVLLLQFAYEHNEKIISNIELPTYYEDSDRLCLSGNSIYQLNLISHSISSCGSRTGKNWKPESVLDVIDFTSTPMGKRKLREIFLSPLTNIDEINKRYDSMEKMLENDSYKSYISNLVCFPDIERLHRKLFTKKISPSEFAILDKSYEKIKKLIHLVSVDKCFDLKKENIDQFEAYIKMYTKKFDIKKMSLCRMSDIMPSSEKDYSQKSTGSFSSNIFIINKGVNVEIDDVRKKIEDIEDFFNQFFREASLIASKKKDPKCVNGKYSDKEGYFIFLTKSKEKILKAELAKGSIITIKENNGKTGVHDYKNLRFVSRQTNSGIAEIKSEKLDEYAKQLVNLRDVAKKLIYEMYINETEGIYSIYCDDIQCITSFVTDIDVLSSNCRASIDLNLCRPVIKGNKAISSKVICKDLRHPIIEEIQKDAPYIPNDITLNPAENCGGILLYGVNSSGKSSVMKSLGIAVVLAQAGMHVPCSYMEYTPFNSLFTRIVSHDDIFKGLSSFAMEINELKTIMRNADKNSLVLGDELCSGTETISAISIITAGILRLSSISSNFIFATHLHQLAEIDEITSLKNVKLYHLKVSGISDNSLIFDRKLMPGNGDPIYGIEICKLLGLDEKFVEKAMGVRRSLLGVHTNILDTKRSRYNKNVFMDDCVICKYRGIKPPKKATETHHLNPQKNADNDGKIKSQGIKFHKNIEHNLIPLCGECHGLITTKKLNINKNRISNIQHPSGLTKKASKTSKKKYSEKDVKTVMKYRHMKPSEVVKKLKTDKEFVKTISETVIRKMLSGKY